MAKFTLEPQNICVNLESEQKAGKKLDLANNSSTEIHRVGAMHLLDDHKAGRWAVLHKTLNVPDLRTTYSIQDDG